MDNPKPMTPSEMAKNPRAVFIIETAQCGPIEHWISVGLTTSKSGLKRAVTNAKRRFPNDKLRARDGDSIVPLTDFYWANFTRAVSLMAKYDG